jgi:hypothetical protein
MKGRNDRPTNNFSALLPGALHAKPVRNNRQKQFEQKDAKDAKQKSGRRNAGPGIDSP